MEGSPIASASARPAGSRGPVAVAVFADVLVVGGIPSGSGKQMLI
jgi:hypothetical protein